MAMAELPDDMISSIMSWLPVKSLLQFRLVCKSWRALTRNPYFIDQHRAHSALRPDATRLLLTYRRESKQTILTASHYGGAPSPILSNILEHGPFSLSCCQGLISMHPREPPTDQPKAKTFVYNPNTRETLSIPFNADAFEGYASVRNYIGFEPVSNQYKLVILGTWHVLDHRSKHCEIITLGSNDWRQVVVNGTPPIDNENDDSTCLNGALHWLTSHSQCILVFDLQSENFRTILGPERIQEGQCVELKLCQNRGRLTLVESPTYRPEASFELWTLKDYRNDVWVRESINFSVSTADIGSHLHIIGGMNNDEILISLLSLKPEAFGYNIKARKGWKINVNEHNTDLENIMLYTESMGMC